MPLSATDFAFVKDLVYREAGIFLEAGKDYLVEARLSGLLRKLEAESVAELIGRLRQSGSGELKRIVIEAMTTNETSFFRDGKPFDILRTNILPELIARRSATRSLSLWCAASSTGQEPYTIAMILSEVLPDLPRWNINFIASDISREMVARCKAGRFSQIEISRGLPSTALVKHFVKHGLEWEISPKLRSMIKFREQNLLHPWPDLQNLDIVFIRNVLIYFDTDTKKQILGRIRRLMKPDGYLFLGGAETTLNLDDGFDRLPADRSGCYRLKGAPTAFGPLRDTHTFRVSAENCKFPMAELQQNFGESLRHPWLVDIEIRHSGCLPCFSHTDEWKGARRKRSHKFTICRLPDYYQTIATTVAIERNSFGPFRQSLRKMEHARLVVERKCEQGGLNDFAMTVIVKQGVQRKRGDDSDGVHPLPAQTACDRIRDISELVNCSKYLLLGFAAHRSRLIDHVRNCRI